MLKKITIFMFTICFLFLFNIERAYAATYETFQYNSTTSNLKVSGKTYTLECEGVTAKFFLNQVSDNNISKSNIKKYGLSGAAGAFFDSTESNRIKNLTIDLNKKDGKNHYALWGQSITCGTTKMVTITIKKGKKQCSGTITIDPASDGGDKNLQRNSSYKFELDVTAKETEKKENFTTIIKTNVNAYGLPCVGDGNKDGDSKGNYYIEVYGTTKALVDDMTQYSKTGSEEDKKKAIQTANEKTKEGGTSTAVKIFSSTTANDFTVNGSQKLDCDSTLEGFINKYWKYIMILAPVLLMVMISLDFAKAIFSSDSALVQKASSNAMKRVIATVILLCLPLIINTILNFFGLELCF